nr:hypothetical protein [Lactococcus cremoris]
MSSPKIDYKKSDKNYYLPKGISLIELPALNYLMIDGKGAPTSPAFQEAIALLYATAYMISMSYRNSILQLKIFSLLWFLHLKDCGQVKMNLLMEK